MPADALYTATKHAVVGYVRATAPLLAGDKIVVTALCPGFTDTPLIADAADSFRAAGFPLLTVDDLADALDAVLDGGQPGECWYVQPGREARPYRPRSVPGAQGGSAESQLFW
jgi:NAD(P)-dependent dehydrogenase (short-subunit alcohol dehydrogenase family)